MVAGRLWCHSDGVARWIDARGRIEVARSSGASRILEVEPAPGGVWVRTDQTRGRALTLIHRATPDDAGVWRLGPASTIADADIPGSRMAAHGEALHTVQGGDMVMFRLGRDGQLRERSRRAAPGRVTAVLDSDDAHALASVIREGGTAALFVRATTEVPAPPPTATAITVTATAPPPTSTALPTPPTSRPMATPTPTASRTPAAPHGRAWLPRVLLERP